METREDTPKKPMTKSEIMTSLSEAADLSKQQVAKLFSELACLIEKSLKDEGPGVFSVPGLMKIKVVRKSFHEGRDDLSSEACKKCGKNRAIKGLERYGLKTSSAANEIFKKPRGSSPGLFLFWAQGFTAVKLGVSPRMYCWHKMPMP